jgi:hypothetical protein
MIAILGDLGHFSAKKLLLFFVPEMFYFESSLPIFRRKNYSIGPRPCVGRGGRPR